MKPRQLTVHTLCYSKADLDRVPEADRLFFLMSTGLTNELQMLLKTLAVIIESTPDNAPHIVNQANSAHAMCIVRMVAGRLCEGWKTLSAFSKTLKADYESDMTDAGRNALRALRAYFNPGNGKRPLITDVRDHVAFHSLRDTVAAAYDGLEDMDDLGDYVSEYVGNTLYYTCETLHYATLKHLTGEADFAEAVNRLREDVMEQAANFTTAIYQFVLVFCRRYLPHALNNLAKAPETFEVGKFDDMNLAFFSDLPRT